MCITGYATRAIRAMLHALFGLRGLLELQISIRAMITAFSLAAALFAAKLGLLG
jgi:hypothetical protein